jgi:hypothetical protein
MLHFTFLRLFVNIVRSEDFSLDDPEPLACFLGARPFYRKGAPFLFTILALLLAIPGFIVSLMQIHDWLADHHFSLIQFYESLKKWLKALLEKSR